MQTSEIDFEPGSESLTLHSSMKGYSARDVATMLGLSASQVRSFATHGFVSPERGERGELRFTFQDLVILRTAKELFAQNIPPRKIVRALKNLRRQLPSGRPLTAVRIAAEGDHIVVQDGGAIWNPDNGQALFDFAVSELVSHVEPHARKAAEEARQDEDALDAEGWYELGFELEIGSPDDARDAYRRAIELDPYHADAHVNLGRLLHEKGEAVSAEAHYRIAIDVDPRHPTAAFNLGVALEDLGRFSDAVAAYQKAIDTDEENADAHYNLSGVYERLGRKTLAFRHLKRYRQLMQEE